MVALSIERMHYSSVQHPYFIATKENVYTRKELFWNTNMAVIWRHVAYAPRVYKSNNPRGVLGEHEGRGDWFSNQ